MTPFFDARVADWVNLHMPGSGDGFGQCQAMGVAHNGRIVAGIVFHNWEPEHSLIELSGAAIDRRWMTRTVLRTMFSYAFSVCETVFARHDEDSPARAIWKALGAEEYLIPRMRGKDKAICISVLAKEAWEKSRFNGGGNGKKQIA